MGITDSQWPGVGPETCPIGIGNTGGGERYYRKLHFQNTLERTQIHTDHSLEIIKAGKEGKVVK